MLELLEARTLFAITGVVSNGVADVTIDSSSPQVSLSWDGSALTVVDSVGDLLKLTGASAISVSASAATTTLNINALQNSPPLVLASGNFVLDPAGPVDVTAITLSSLTINAGVRTTIAADVIAGAHDVLNLNQLVLAPAAGRLAMGSLDLGGNDLILHASNSSQAGINFSAVTAAVRSGFANGSESGSGIGHLSTNPLQTLGVEMPATSTTFDGVAVGTNDVIVRQTLFGDANLDGQVDGSDYTRIDNGYNNHLSGWVNGDFNDDGVINGSDYTLIDNAFNTEPSLPAAPHTVDFASSAPSLFLLGDFGSGSYQGHNYVSQGNGRLDTVIVGSSASFMAYVVPGQTVRCTVDGASTVYTSNSSSFATIAIFSQLADQPHHVIIQSGSANQLYFDSNNTLQVTGSNPRLESPAFAGPSGTAQYLDVFTAPFTTYGQIDGDPQYYPGFGEVYPASNAETGLGAGIRFKAQVTNISLWTNNSNIGILTRFVLYQDGVPIASPTLIPQDSYWNVQPIASGLDGTAVHDYDIVPISSGGYLQLYGLILGGGTGLATNSTPEPAKPQWGFFGDTIINGSVGLATDGSSIDADIRQTDAWMLAQHEGVTPLIDGTAGASVGQYGSQYAQQIDAFPGTFAKVFLRYGFDDILYGVSVSTFQADYQAMLNTINQNLSATTSIEVEGILPTTSFSAAVLEQYNAAIAAAVSAVGSSRIHFIDTTGWFDPAVDTFSNGAIDGVHPDAAGYISIYNHELAALGG